MGDVVLIIYSCIGVVVGATWPVWLILWIAS